ncbi:MAG: DNA polymerase [Burkholderiales bacterium]
MRTVFLDFETYYDKEYSLRKMTPVEYVLDPRFEMILVTVRENGKLVGAFDHEQFIHYLSAARLHECMVTSHNALFDMCILAWRYTVTPRVMVDTLGISRALFGHILKSLSLASVAAYLGIGFKGHEVHNVIGMHAADIKASGRWQAYVDYCAKDAELCEGIFNKTVKTGLFPIREIAIMDMVLRCAIQPKFLLDQMVLAEHLAQVKADKEALIARTGVSKDELMSNEKFAQALRTLGVDPPMKTSPTTGKEAYAFAKVDKGFIELEEHPNPDVQALVAARAGFKSTLEETRTERLIKIANLTWPGNQQQQQMPVPLRYGGAHTHRLSGDWKLNMQNLPRGSKLRRALIARQDEIIFTIDASQIEARVTAWLCGQDDLVQQFANGEDVYSSFAAEVFGYPVNKKQHPKERFIGKTSVLGLGFGVGFIKFADTIEVQSQLQLGEKVPMPIEESQRIVDLYRTKYNKISSAWRLLNTEGIAALAGGHIFKFGPCTFEPGAVLLPSGLRLHYHNLQQVDGERGKQWEFTYGGEPKKLYGGKLLENIVQALARIITMDAAMRIQKSHPLGMQVHDELVYGIQPETLHEFRALALQEMRRRPDWAPELPLEAEAGVGASYGEAK